jgi:hypothetical protein
MAPNTAQDWITVANERAADAEAMLSSRQDSVGPVYMVGYAIECSLIICEAVTNHFLAVVAQGTT